MKINLCAETAESSSHKNTKGVKSYELRTKSGGTATTGAFCLNCDLCDFNDLYDSDCRNHTTHKTSVAFFLCIMLYFCGWTGVSNMSAQDTEFWFVAPDISKGADAGYPWSQPVYFMITAGDKAANVTLSMPALLGNIPLRTFNVEANQSKRIVFGDGVTLLDSQITDTIENTITVAGVSGVKHNRGIQIISDNPVFAYYSLSAYGTKSMFALKGRKALGKSFYIPFQQKYVHDIPGCYTQFHVVASQDNTAVTITPTADWYGGTTGTRQTANVPYSVTLDKGQTVAIRTYDTEASPPGFMGSTVSADQPVAVTVNEDHIWIPAEGTYAAGGDNIGDQLVPVENVGCQYVVIRGFTGPNQGDYVYILATHSGTTTVDITPLGGTKSTMSITGAGNYIQYHLSQNAAFISANHPIYVLQQSGMNGEADGALVPSMYSINGRSFSFYKETAGWHRVFILARSGSEGYFLVNGNASVITAADFQDVTGVTGWKFARKDITTSVLNNTEGTVKITNSTGAFSLGYFFTGTTSGSGQSASFGYLSAYGDFSFPTDTVYKCAGSAYTLDGGYALSYSWTLPDGSTATTATLSASMQGLYKLTVDQDPTIIKDSIRVLDRFDSASIVSSGGNDVGDGTYTYSVDLHGQPATNVNYVWKVDGVQVSTNSTYSVTWTNVDEHLITVEISDASLGCSKTLDLVHYKFPDNISDKDCFTEIPSITWSIDKSFESNSSNQTMTAYTTPIVGDLDNDGIPEILVYNYVSATDPRTVNKVYVFWGTDRANPTEFSIPTTSYMHPMGALAKVEIGGVMTPMLVFQATDGYLYAYNPVTGMPIWNNGAADGKSDAQINDWVTATGAAAVMPQAVGFADFDGDGKVEVYASSSVWAAENGKLLVRGAGNKGYAQSYYKNYYTVAVDVDEDGIVDLAAGTDVYEVHTPYRNGTHSTNTMTVKYQIPGQTVNGLTITDGTTITADINKDGKPDIIVTNNNGGINYGILVWDPRKQAVIATGGGTNADYPSTPFTGNIDSDPNMEILYITTQNLDGWRYDGTTTLQHPYQTSHSDGSGATGITLFDFDSDGTPELVYRDEKNLRIMHADAATGTINDLRTIACISGTYKEYPVVADVDGEGSSAILVMGGVGNVVSPATLRIYKSAGEPWAPARKVWNQYNYNVVNINEDLTVPRRQFNPATYFPGPDGKHGTADDIQPYNAFLQQQTELNKSGAPLWLAADAKFDVTAPAFNYFADGDSLIITVRVHNAGDAGLQAPFYISAYKNARNPANIIAVDSCMTTINPGATVPVSVTVRNLSAYSFSKIVISLNDKNGNDYIQPECDPDVNDDNEQEYNEDLLLRAHNDQVTTIGTIPVRIDVLTNDSIPTGCTPTPSIVAPLAKYGSATVVNDSVQYTANAVFVGFDTIVYKIVCGANTSTARMIVRVQEFPDNVDDADCVIVPTGKEWSIQRTQRIDSLATTSHFVVGDMNDDGYPDIAGYGTSDRKSIRIIWGPDFSTNNKYLLSTNDSYGQLAIAKVKINNSPETFQTMLYYQMGGYLYAMRSDGTSAWTSNPVCRNRGMINVADFNNDGWAEVYTGNQIYDAATGKLLCDGGTSENIGKSYIITTQQSLTMAIDILGDEKLELVAGNKIYGVDIDRSVTTPKFLTVLSSVTPPTGCPDDGVTVVADFNNDGKLEVLVRRKQGDNTDITNIHLYLWSPHTGTNTGTILANTIDNNRYLGIPFTGDIDGDGQIEIITLDANGTVNITQTGRLRAYKYNETTNSFDLFWAIDHTDQSGATGMTLFDFNNDGISEIVYRDEQSLRIINGSKKHHVTGVSTGVYTLDSIVSYSETGLEYPLVVDIYGNGSSAILVTSDYRGPRNSSQSDQGFAGNATVDIFTSYPSTPWSPARKVWNQYAYNAVNVNNDLTVPAVQLSLATRFPGADGVINTPDDIRPYNAFLQQQTRLNKGGAPLWLAPDAKFTGTAPALNYHSNGDSLVIITELTNAGDAALNSPFYISAYKNTAAAANKMATDSSMMFLNVGDITTVTLTIRNFSSYKSSPGLTGIVIRINDKGAVEYVQQECEYDNNVLTVPFANFLMAQNDRAATFPAVPVKVGILTNDSIPSGCTPTPSIVAPFAKHGTATVVNDSVQYLSTGPGFTGLDTVVYSISCNGNTSTASVTVRIYEFPGNVSDADCHTDPPATMDWNLKLLDQSTTQVHTLGIAYAGDIDGDGRVEILAPAASNGAYDNVSTLYAFNDSLDVKYTIDFGAGVNVLSNAISIADVDGDGKAEIFACSADGYLRKYSFNGTDFVADGSVQHTTNSDYYYCQPMIVDFDGNGVPEILVLDRIYNAGTLALLVDGAMKGVGDLGYGSGHVATSGLAANKNNRMISAGDIDNDGLPEVLAGTTAYKVNITNTTGAAGNTFTIHRQADKTGRTETGDGATAIADMDLDGYLDVIVSRRIGGNKAALFVWNPRTGEIMNTNVVDTLLIAPIALNVYGPWGPSIPSIGDIDGDGKPEIVLVSQDKGQAYPYGFKFGRLVAYDFDNGVISEKWRVIIDDYTATTGVTLFDFNQDGAAEIVFRDIVHLYILDGRDGSELIIPAVCSSPTGMKYPVIVDYNNDGAAEIIVSGGTATTLVDPPSPGTLRVYGSGGSKWASARKVWNQYAYNAVNVNEDLTIPAVQLNPATRFPGNDGVIGTPDDARPYNGYLQQQTALVKSGAPLWIAPDVKFTGKTPVINYPGPSLILSVEITNTGDAGLIAPFYISAYKNSVAAGNIIATDNSTITLNAGDTMTVDVTIYDFSSHTPLTDVIIILNNRVDGYVQKECDYNNNSDTITFTGLFMAFNDYAATFQDIPVKVSIRANDLIPSGCATPAFSIIAPPAKYGAATLTAGNDSVLYIPSDPDYMGYDTVKYQIVCGSETVTADVIINIQELPDNVSNMECYTVPPAMEWSFNQTPLSIGENLLNYSPIYAGDLDGDKLPELVTIGNDNSTDTWSGRTVYIYMGTDRSDVQEIQLPDVTRISLAGGAIALGRIKINNTVDTSLIFIIGVDSYIYAYSLEDLSTPFWKSAVTFPNTYKYYTQSGRPDCSDGGAQTLGIADFNGDGYAELYINNSIFDAATGQLLCRATGNEGFSNAHTGNLMSVTIAGDFDNDGKLELAAGNTVWKVNINRINNSTMSADITEYSKILLPSLYAGAEDGHTQVVDLDLDGRLDVVVSRVMEATTVLYAWNPLDKKLIAGATCPSGHNNCVSWYCGYGKSLPFIGDVDNAPDKRPEILLLTDYIRAYKYDGTATLSLFWTLYSSDISYGTGLTLFDFNQDGTNEIVYRDMTTLRIIDGSTSTPGIKAAIYSPSITVTEQPVVVDLENDQSAEILVTSGQYTYNSSIRVYKPLTGTWAPSRTVWNQYAYNVVNVNEDLTIPKVQRSPATAFPGNDGVIGTADDMRPYNNFLQQQTTLNIKGTMLWLTPDAKFTGAPPKFNHYGVGDSLVISVDITNIGNSALRAPFYISSYKNSVTAANKMSTGISTVSLNVGDTTTVVVTIRNFSTYTSLTDIIIAINDRGDAAYVQKECDYDNNIFEYDQSGLLKSANDTVAMLIDTAVTIDVKFNDAIPSGCSLTVPAVIVPPSVAGSVAATVNDSIKYTPVMGFYGVDSLVYRLTCTLNDTVYTTEAKVYIVVNKPKSATYIACEGAKTTAGFEAIANVRYYWYTTETGGSPDGLASDTRDCEAPGVWWVEARYKDKPVRPRLNVTINKYPDLDLTGFSIGDVQTVCHGNVPAQLKATGSPSGGNGASYDYQWQQSADNSVWTNVTDSTNTTLTPPALTSGTYYRLNVTSCETKPSNVVKITVRPKSLYNYPDLRIRVCPDAGTSINLSKYIDTLDVSSLSWKSVAPYLAINSVVSGPVSTGTISADDLKFYTRVYTLAYTVGNPCASDIRRTVYLEVLKNGRIHPLRDSIVICYLYAEALQINQIFGIDARGTWSFEAFEADGVTPVNVDAYVTQSQSPTYKGAVIMNGKAIYENTGARKIFVTS